ncbi:hypothetical protein HPP92_010753 [Vanilla planifolia]|uniref:Saposin B-type domain-containing protein n=1 Tax=Vanilla planifolia TaxID=51239 RepID=A0A835R5R5_VANPL|nr:hypothetical protein HPP92_010753 [Vanilla planifolia]
MASIQVKMETTWVSLFIALLIPMVFADTMYSIVPMLKPEGDSRCNSCLEASRKAERALNGMKLLEQFDVLSTQVCHALPAKFEAQCLNKSKMEIARTESSMKELFHQNSLCISTGMCSEQVILQEMEEIFAENKIPPDFEDETDCMFCRRAVRGLLSKLRQPKMRTKIFEALIEYCEESEDNEDQCKKTVHRYGPTVLAKLEKLKSADLCLMMSMCTRE